MKNRLWIKGLIIVPAIAFADYLIMIIFGCEACLFGAGEEFYCGAYCLTGKIILGISGLLFVFLAYRELSRIKRVKGEWQDR